MWQHLPGCDMRLRVLTANPAKAAPIISTPIDGGWWGPALTYNRTHFSPHGCTLRCCTALARVIIMHFPSLPDRALAVLGLHTNPLPLSIAEDDIFQNRRSSWLTMGRCCYHKPPPSTRGVSRVFPCTLCCKIAQRLF